MPPKRSRIRYGHGIPIDFMVPALSDAPGAVLTKYGYAVVKKDAEAYVEAAERKSKQAKVELPEIEVPTNFICPICDEVMTDAVKTSCCATHFCDSCVRNALVADDEKSCPKCDTIEYPDSLQPNIVLRNAIKVFSNKTRFGVKVIRKSSHSKGESSNASTSKADTTAVSTGPHKLSVDQEDTKVIGATVAVTTAESTNILPSTQTMTSTPSVNTAIG
ncbi:hypothetical protein EB796_001186 [Bugula neritina]|uniref:RING-type domain-containing protein n=1 Tax=Bugula neritina TaxID=10212 RepID=A0A7J7KQP5_BUGNE|nr:hypothetical protein EB796_001186 [Bugula neritina]